MTDADGQPWADFDALCVAEAGSLPNPYTSDPEALFAWEANPVLKEVKVVGSGPEHAFVLAAVDDYYGLNPPELRALRWLTYRKLNVFRLALASQLLEEDLKEVAREEIRQMTAAEEPFAGMCRYFVRRVWILPL